VSVVTGNSESIVSRLHSRYKPDVEAERYIAALNLPLEMDYCVVIEPGLGYLISALQKCHPDCKAVVLHAAADFRGNVIYARDIPSWFPDSGKSVQEFLEAAIPDAASVRLIEWKPSLNVYGKKYLELVRETTEFIKRINAGRRTTAAFGKRWVRNFFRNLTLLDNVMLYRTMDLPVIITGSGPSLESALPSILPVRDGVFILAASSSLPALAAGGITPDMVISTDGGGWALLHLHACFRDGRLTADCKSAALTVNAGFTLAITLNAAVPSQGSAIPMLLMSDGSLWQNIALHSIGIPSAFIPQRGTVTASALELAMVLSSGNIFLAGMDLSIQDIRSHARPYGFDQLFFGAASRFRPVYSQYFSRSNDIKAGGSHDVYANWFKNKVASWPKRIFSLGGNHAVFECNVRKVSLSGGGGGRDFFKVVTANKSPAERARCALDALTAALQDPGHSAVLAGELSPLLFPSVSGVAAGDIAKALRDISWRYWGECG
jgi:hypothetical protein